MALVVKQAIQTEWVDASPQIVIMGMFEPVGIKCSQKFGCVTIRQQPLSMYRTWVERADQIRFEGSVKYQ